MCFPPTNISSGQTCQWPQMIRGSRANHQTSLVLAVRWLIPFGQHILASWPVLTPHMAAGAQPPALPISHTGHPQTLTGCLPHRVLPGRHCLASGCAKIINNSHSMIWWLANASQLNIWGVKLVHKIIHFFGQVLVKISMAFNIYLANLQSVLKFQWILKPIGFLCG